MQVQEIQLDKIVPTPDNPRTIRKSDPKLKELAESIAKHGVLEPLIGRPHPDKPGHIDLRAGERRFHASGMAGLEVVPVIVRDMTDEEAFEVTITENMQREDLTPLEEAAGIRKMLDHGWTLDQAASQLGKSLSWVARRAQLTNLSKTWRKVIESSPDVAAWPAAQLELIARLPQSVQDEYAQERFHRVGHGAAIPTLLEIRRWTANHAHLLSSAPWKLDDESLVPKCGSCLACTKRSACQGELFDDGEFDEPKSGKKAKKGSSSDRCLDVACWDKKYEAWVKVRLAELKSEYPNLVIMEPVNYNEKPQFSGSVQAMYSWYECRKDDKNARPCFVVCGHNIGKFYWARRTDDSAGGRSKKSSAGDDKPKTVADRRKDLERLRRRIVIHNLVERIEAMVKAGPKSLTDSTLSTEQMLALVHALGTAFRNDSSYAGSPKPSYDKWAKADISESVRVLFLSALSVLAWRWRSGFGHDGVKAGEEEFICGLLNIDLEAVWEQARQEKPEPKSWAKLEEAEKTGKPKVKKASGKTKASKGKAA